MTPTRPQLVWTIAALCAATVVVALAVVSARVLDYERERAQSAAEAELSDRVRLALWRMESEAASILTVENSRPVDQFKPYFAPALSWDAANSRPAPDSLLQPSDLLNASPDYARLHFELDADGLRSPQVPRGGFEIVACAQGLVSGPPLEASERLSALRDRLGLRPDLLPETLRDRVQTLDLEVRNQIWSNLPPVPLPQAEESDAAFRQTTNRAEDAGYDRLRRAESVARVAEKGIQSNTKSETPPPTPKTPAIESDAAPPSAELYRTVPPPSPPTATPYQASWIGGDLFLIRRVGDDATPRIQGVWLEKSKLEADLLGSIADLLPRASLLPIATAAVAGPLAMVSLPYQLVAGESPVAPVIAWSPTHALLTSTWAAVIAALAAAFALLFGVVRLSERRASFVSSVTHELRTPLTTFKLYSEMLAENMVPDPQRRSEYLGTLRREAERLSHLVENVLSYSRVERGSARAHRQATTAPALVDSILPRLRERASAANLEITVTIDPAAAETPVETDLTAVEQILFNLVDNAAKYAAASSDRSDESNNSLELTVHRTGRRLAIALRDHGPGISPQDRRKLFRPFSKSAAEAAATQPGVGLGLALSRRLARSLGGDLRHQATTPGTRFTLTLPAPGVRGHVRALDQGDMSP